MSLQPNFARKSKVSRVAMVCGALALFTTSGLWRSRWIYAK